MFKENPKWIIGYSDITAFHNHIHNLGVETMHAMMATSLEEKPTFVIPGFAYPIIEAFMNYNFNMVYV